MKARRLPNPRKMRPLLNEKEKNSVPRHARLPDERVKRQLPQNRLGQFAIVPSSARYITGITGNRPQRHGGKTRLQVSVGHESALPVDHHITNYAPIVVKLLYIGAVERSKTNYVS